MLLAICILATLAASSPITYNCRDNHGSRSDYRFEIRHDVVKQKNGDQAVDKYNKNVNKHYSVKSKDIKNRIDEYKDLQKEKKEQRVYDIFDYFKFHPEIKFGHSFYDGFIDNTDPRNDREDWETDESNNSDDSNKDKSNKDVTKSFDEHSNDNEGEFEQKNSHDVHDKNKSYSSDLVDFIEDNKDEIQEKDVESNQTDVQITSKDNSKPEHKENSDDKEDENISVQDKESSDSKTEEHIS
ncbi:unnamed protein product [Parnassius apollo]|uniref:(apollo) hypothetical protein n=1 Tax=Parnassius apollo TaxID=110799 RepID=A0A8S3XY25_PARAO|nr:unnamed protein product [Parnassius apollo]